MENQLLTDFIQSRQRLLIITGAGVSTGSGIPDYRDKNGEWKRKQPMYYQEFMADEIARKRYWARSMQGWPMFSSAKPNSIHKALAAIEKQHNLAGIITQNVDRLHQLAGSQRVIDLHGRLDRVRCTACKSSITRTDLQQLLIQHNPDWRSATAMMAPDGDADLIRFDFEHFKVPPCDLCGGILKPDVVFFGENVPRPRVQEAQEWLEACDGVLVLGSSLMVFSSFRFVRAAAERNLPVVAVNHGRTRADDLLQWKLETDCEKALSVWC